MKVAQLLGYGLAFAFILVCALLTALASRESAKPPTPGMPGPQTAFGTPGPGPGSGSASGRPAFRWSLEEYFHSRDSDGDGRLSGEESAAASASSDPERAERSRRFFEASDGDGDGFVTLDESRAWWEKVRTTMDRARERFVQQDVDQDGRVSRDEALAGQDDGPAAAGLAVAFDRFDTDADGYVDYRELRSGVFAMLAR